MRKVILALGVCMIIGNAPVSHAATPQTHFSTVVQTSVEHGGGCRKDSPPGQCCHAGSKPYHCH